MGWMPWHKNFKPPAWIESALGYIPGASGVWDTLEAMRGSIDDGEEYDAPVRTVAAGTGGGTDPRLLLWGGVGAWYFLAGPGSKAGRRRGRSGGGRRRGGRRYSSKRGSSRRGRRRR